jgi:hypothetical protein
MSTIRAFVNKKRIATARQINPSTFQQFFPAKITFKDEKEWKEIVARLFGSSVSFDGNTQVSAPAPAPAPAPANPKKQSSSALLDGKNWKFDSNLKQTLPAGKYWIGDICYCLPEEIYDNIFGGVGGYDGGFYTHKDGGFFMVDSTAYGDGCYEGSDGFGYGVDAGIIGIVSEKLIDMTNEALYGGKIHTFDKPVTCKFKGGKFTFEAGYHWLEINTQ